MTRKRIVTYSPFDVVSVPFPFTDQNKRKRRPALVLSSKTFNDPVGHSVMAMITSSKNAPWPLDIKITDLKSAGLSAKSVVRMKFFTLDHRFVLGKIGNLSNIDQRSVSESIEKLLQDILSL